LRLHIRKELKNSSFALLVLPAGEVFVNLDSLSGNLFEHADSLYKLKDYTMMAEYFTRLWRDGPFREPSAVAPAIRNYVLQTVKVNNTHADDYWPVFNHEGRQNTSKELRHPCLS
jgi:hypothetical protein